MKILKKYQLTSKALEYIYKHGRNGFNDMINELIEQKKNIYKDGWVNKKVNNTRRKKR